VLCGLIAPAVAASVQCTDLWGSMCRLVSEYMQLAPSDMVADSVELLCGEPVLRMVHTHAGCRVGCLVAAWSTPKERKKLLKAMKGHVVKMCLDEFAYVALIKLLSVVDDTQLVYKCAVAEIAVRLLLI
jgi:pumilio homology domain family member 6